MTPEIEKKIIDKYTATSGGGYKMDGAAFGYSLAEGEIDQLRLLNKIEVDANEKCRQEIDRLKGLLEKVFKENNGYDLEAVEGTNTYNVGQNIALQEQEWQQFKTYNNL